MCCDSPWVTTISCFIHNAASPQLIRVKLRSMILIKHHTGFGLYLLTAKETKKKGVVKLHCNPQELQTSCRAEKVHTGSWMCWKWIVRNVNLTNAAAKLTTCNMNEAVTSLLWHLWPTRLQVVFFFFSRQVLADIDQQGNQIVIVMASVYVAHSPWPSILQHSSLPSDSS